MKDKIILLIISLSMSLVSAQQGTVSGVLYDDLDLPIPGVNIIIKGTNKSTQTDFDGNYSITCYAGNTLVFSYIGMTTKEVVVTPDMFKSSTNELQLEYVAVKAIHSDAYTKAIKGLKKEGDSIKSIGNSNRTYNKNKGDFNYNRIKEVDILDNKVKLRYFDPDIYFEVVYNSSFAVQFIRDRNLPELQTSFSQGIPVSGELTFQGAETENIFSYGPALNTLEFNGNDYLYDANGQLVNRGNGNATPAIPYNNALFENVILNSNQLAFNISTEYEWYGINFFNENSKDIYNRERSYKTNISLNYKKYKQANKLGWKAFLNYELEKNNQPNINGFNNNMLFNLWSTPPSFSNKQGSILPDNTQRRFSTQFNNPEWLLNNNQNAIENKNLVAGTQNKIDITDNIRLEGKLNYSHNFQKQKFGLVSGSAGFEDGFLSNKTIKENNFNAVGHFKYIISENEIELKSITNYNYNSLDFSLIEFSGFTPFSFTNASNSRETNQTISRHILRLLNQFKYELDDKLEFKLINNSYYSSIQKSKWFLPSLYAKIDLKKSFNIYGNINTFSISTNVSFDVNDVSLYYNNLSHNSLLLSPEESLKYTSNNDLFINPSVDLEEVENYEANLSFGLHLFGGITNLNVSFYNSKTKGSVFPIVNSGVFILDNVADIKNSGLEFSLDSRIKIVNALYYKPNISFSKYDTEVLKLLNNKTRIPIAGFSTVSKNLLVGEPTGVIVGSAYQRDSQNNVVIGANGFPLVNDVPQIIGNPIPDYNIGFSNNFKWKNLTLNVVIDIQKGGDIWNGTQNVLNYLGTSQQSATQRGVTNFIFNGVDELGNTNTIPVDFYSANSPISENRFVRYGFEGVDEDAIVDASYINIKSIDVSYTFKKKHNSNPLLRTCQLGLYAKNLFTWSKFRGNSPYETLYGNNLGQALNFFNTPLLSEVGFTLKIKI